jgi:hypothetical protein
MLAIAAMLICVSIRRLAEELLAGSMKEAN